MPSESERISVHSKALGDGSQQARVQNGAQGNQTLGKEQWPLQQCPRIPG